MMRALIFILVLFAQGELFAGAVINRSVASGDLYIISIGVDDYSKTSIGQRFGACESDAKLITDKFSKDYLRLSPRGSEEHGLLKSYTLINEQANYQMIKEVFKQVALHAKEGDNFVFFFAGYTFGNYLVPYYEGDSNSVPLSPALVDSTAIDSNWISLDQLAEWMEDIAAKNQLIISEAGYGKEFALNLISSLFEGNALIASTIDRNRVLLTTKNLGSEGYFCGSSQRVGALAHFVSRSRSAMLAFTNRDAFEYDLLKTEMECGAFRTTYTAIYDENQYRKLLLRHQLQQMYRSVIAEDLEEDSSADSNLVSGQNYALIISTTDYKRGRPSWTNLSNPKRDADDMANILESKYGFKISRLHNRSSDEVVTALIELKRSLQPRDKVLIFIAGHGHYDEDYGTGFLVFNDGASLKAEKPYKTYLSLSTLRNIIDPFPSDHVFLVLDVCFGGQFDINEDDIRLSHYALAERDLSLQEWMLNKDTTYHSRIFLASGTGEVPDYWSNSLRHSPFASKLLHALKEEDEFFSPGKLFLYTEGNITAPVLKQFGRHDTRGDFLIPVVSQP